MDYAMEQAIKSLGENVTLQTEVLRQLIAAQTGEKQIPATGHTGITLHGPGGIFSGCGLEREVITAHVEPHGIMTELPLLPSTDVDPRYASLTGFTDTYGTQPSNACGDAPYSYMKGCNLTAQFGLLRFDTNTIEFDVVMRRWNRGDFLDLALMGNLFMDQDVSKGLVPSGLDPKQILNIVTMAEMIGAGVQAQRELTRQAWQGLVALGEFPGLDSQIATGQVDADTNTACPALDSDVKSFGYDDVCGTGRDIVEYVSMMHWYLYFNAQRMKLTPVKWAIIMRPELWYELSACWPCRYMANRCQTNSGTEIAVINDENNTRMRDGMREGMFLWVNGQKIPVITDDGIFEYNNINNSNLLAGEYASSIYFVPLTILGRFPVTYRQYLNYKDEVAARNISLLKGKEIFWTDRGVFSWAVEHRRWCYLLSLKTEQRVVLRTPQLAGKIQHVKYSPLQHLRSPFPDSPYFADGGVSYRAPGTRYAVWASGGIAGR